MSAVNGNSSVSPSPTHPKPEALASELWHALRLADDALFRAKDACEGYPRDAINCQYICDQLTRVVQACRRAADTMPAIALVQQIRFEGEEPVYLNDRFGVVDDGDVILPCEGGDA